MSTGLATTFRLLAGADTEASWRVLSLCSIRRARRSAKRARWPR